MTKELRVNLPCPADYIPFNNAPVIHTINSYFVVEAINIPKVGSWTRPSVGHSSQSKDGNFRKVARMDTHK